ncbi:MAG: 30S ribosomal protein S6 [Gloeobacterales cyanobacterium]
MSIVARRYETLFILNAELVDEALTTAVAAYTDLLTNKGAEHVVTNIRGKRRLAYEIKNLKEGVYVQLNYDADAATKAELERALKLDEKVLRFLTVLDENEFIPEVKEPVEV